MQLRAVCVLACAAYTTVGFLVAPQKRASAIVAAKNLPAPTGAKARVRTSRPKGQGRTAQNKRRGDMMRSMIVEEPVVIPSEAARNMMSDGLMPLIKCIAKTADDRKARTTVAYYVAPLTSIATFVLMTNGRSKPQNDAIAASIVNDVKAEFGRSPRHVEGGSDGGWTLLDFGDIIVNVMTARSREYYDLDALWKKAEIVDLSDVLTPDSDMDDDEFDMLDDDDIFDEALADDDIGFDDPWDAPQAADDAASPWI
ncbi:hypothetical protein M885DRAFT_543070 [Pelagophyceae sp. CCMP2097]|nr:hypothetical protein M885DRAFT_543070 [Pelagophyceae sp. CCMP2097]